LGCLLVTTFPGSERAAADGLAERGHDVFLPMMRAEFVLRGARRMRASPLFPGYVFAWASDSGAWHAMSAVRGVSGFVSVGRNSDGDAVPYVFPDRVIDDVVTSVASSTDDAGYFVDQPRYSPGQRLRVASRGLWEGVEVVLSGNDAMGRVRCLLGLLGRQVERVFYERDLEPLAA
jgi:transcription antitermination factor NusG